MKKVFGFKPEASTLKALGANLVDDDYLWRCEPCRLLYDPDVEQAVDGRCPRCGERTQPVKTHTHGESGIRGERRT